jgi:CheY-like chemotaxis protein
MTAPVRPRILVVDDEEAILETMAFTFEDDYEVLTSSDARRALEILAEQAPVAVVLTDQRMPSMSGVEFLREVWRRHPSTVRMILTGFADMDAILGAINDGHVYAYVTKPWEPDHLKQVMKQAVEHHRLAVENERLLTRLKRANVFLEAVMDELDTGALAVDAAGIVQAANRPLVQQLGLPAELRGKPLAGVLASRGLQGLSGTLDELAADASRTYDEVDVRVGERLYRMRVALHNLRDPSGESFGRVIFLREISHEPLRRQFEDAVQELAARREGLRAHLERSVKEIGRIAEQARSAGVRSAGMAELEERAARTITALQNWLDVDDALAREDYPDAQLLMDRMRVALARWPLPEAIPQPVVQLTRRVEAYYESGENPRQRVL